MLNFRLDRFDHDADIPPVVRNLTRTGLMGCIGPPECRTLLGTREKCIFRFGRRGEKLLCIWFEGEHVHACEVRREPEEYPFARVIERNGRRLLACRGWIDDCLVKSHRTIRPARLPDWRTWIIRHTDDIDAEHWHQDICSTRWIRQLLSSGRIIEIVSGPFSSGGEALAAWPDTRLAGQLRTGPCPRPLPPVSRPTPGQPAGGPCAVAPAAGSPPPDTAAGLLIRWQDMEHWLRRLGWPDLGTVERWRWWFGRTWLRLTDQGWFEPDHPGCLTPSRIEHERMTLFTLRWLVEDYVARLEPEAEFTPDWGEWGDVLGIDHWAWLNLMRRAGGVRWAQVERLVKEEQYYDDLEFEFDNERELIDYRSEYEETLAWHAVTQASAQMREELVPELEAVWDEDTDLCRSLWAATGPRWDDEEDDEEASDDPELLLPEDRLLCGDRAAKVNADADDAFPLDPDLFDSGTIERAEGLGWVARDCPIVCEGYPAYICPD